MIVTAGLKKAFGSVQALSGVDLKVAESTVVGLAIRAYRRA